MIVGNAPVSVPTALYDDNDQDQNPMAVSSKIYSDEMWRLPACHSKRIRISVFWTPPAG
jgi:hypothetical protein